MELCFIITVVILLVTICCSFNLLHSNSRLIEQLQNKVMILERELRNLRRQFHLLSRKTSDVSETFTESDEETVKEQEPQNLSEQHSGTLAEESVQVEEFELEIIPEPVVTNETDTEQFDQELESELKAQEEPAIELVEDKPPSSEQEISPVFATKQQDRHEEEEELDTFEKILASRWLSWLGAVTVIIGSGLFFKYTIDIGLIGPKERVLIGLGVGALSFCGGVWAMLKQYRHLSQGLVGSAMGILYFSIFAAVDWYNLVSPTVGFSGLAFVTFITLTYSGWFNTQTTAVLGMFGGFITPYMLFPGEHSLHTLFSYLLILDLGVLYLTTTRKWTGLQLMALIGTALSWNAWLFQHHNPADLNITIAWLSTFFVLFALLSIWNHLVQKREVSELDFAVILLTPLLYFGALLWLVHPVWPNGEGLLSLGMALVYAGLGLLSWMRVPEHKNLSRTQFGLSMLFFVIAVPLHFEGHWLPIMWTAQSLLLVEFGLRTHQAKLRYVGIGLLLIVQIFLATYAADTLTRPSYAHDVYVKQIDHPIAAVPKLNTTDDDIAAPMSFNPRELINERSICFFGSFLTMLILGWEYRRRSDSEREYLENESTEQFWTLFSANAAKEYLTISGWLNIGWMVTLFALLSLEVYSIGKHMGWISEAYLSFFSITASLIGLVAWHFFSRLKPHWGLGLVYGMMALTTMTFAVSACLTFTQWDTQHVIALTAERYPSLWKVPVFNLRGIGHLALILSAAFLYTRSRFVLDLRKRLEQDGDVKEQVLTLDSTVWQFFFGGITLAGSFVLVTLEAYAIGIQNNWGTGTALAITGVWTLHALSVLLFGLWKKAPELRNTALALFLLATAKVYLYDLWYLDKTIRMIAFIGLGVVLLLIPWLYKRYRNRLN